MKLANVEEMRRIEQQTDARGHSYSAMMEMAGRAVADAALSQGLAARGHPVLVLVGPGNNGGDGLVAAHYLVGAGCRVSLYLWKRNVENDPNFRRLTQGGERCRVLWADKDPGLAALRQELAQCRVVIDAFLGTGAARPIEGQLADILATVRRAVAGSQASAAVNSELRKSPLFPLREATDIRPVRPPDPDHRAKALRILAVDCPTGLNCDTGALDPAAVPADLTVTFAYPKWGHVQHPGAGACGELAVVDIGVPANLEDSLRVELVERAQVVGLLPIRPRDANKGTFGKALVAGGSKLYTGAPALSGLAAARSGAGLVTVALPGELQPFLAAQLLSLTWLPLPSADGRHCREGGSQLRQRLTQFDAVLVGPGLTVEASAAAFLDELLSAGALEAERMGVAQEGAQSSDAARVKGPDVTGSFVFDADALNLLARMPGWPGRLPPRSALTPHPGEMSRLTRRTTAEINGNRIALARQYAQEWGHVVLLKGAHTVIANPDGRAAVLPFADPALAKAGSGDALAGIIVALLAQGLGPYEATLAGGYVHGMAGVLAGQRAGAASVTAEDLVDAIGESLATLYAAKR